MAPLPVTAVVQLTTLAYQDPAANADKVWAGAVVLRPAAAGEPGRPYSFEVWYGRRGYALRHQTLERSASETTCWGRWADAVQRKEGEGYASVPWYEPRWGLRDALLGELAPALTLDAVINGSNGSARRARDAERASVSGGERAGKSELVRAWSAANPPARTVRQPDAVAASASALAVPIPYPWLVRLTTSDGQVDNWAGAGTPVFLLPGRELTQIEARRSGNRQTLYTAEPARGRTLREQARSITEFLQRCDAEWQAEVERRNAEALARRITPNAVALRAGAELLITCADGQSVSLRGATIGVTNALLPPNASGPVSASYRLGRMDSTRTWLRAVDAATRWQSLLQAVNAWNADAVRQNAAPYAPTAVFTPARGDGIAVAMERELAARGQPTAPLQLTPKRGELVVLPPGTRASYRLRAGPVAVTFPEGGLVTLADGLTLEVPQPPGVFALGNPLAQQLTPRQWESIVATFGTPLLPVAAFEALMARTQELMDAQTTDLGRTLPAAMTAAQAERGAGRSAVASLTLDVPRGTLVRLPPGTRAAIVGPEGRRTPFWFGEDGYRPITDTRVEIPGPITVRPDDADRGSRGAAAMGVPTLTPSQIVELVRQGLLSPDDARALLADAGMPPAGPQPPASARGATARPPVPPAPPVERRRRGSASGSGAFDDLPDLAPPSTPGRRRQEGFEL